MCKNEGLDLQKISMNLKIDSTYCEFQAKMGRKKDQGVIDITGHVTKLLVSQVSSA